MLQIVPKGPLGFERPSLMNTVWSSCTQLNLGQLQTGLCVGARLQWCQKASLIATTRPHAHLTETFAEPLIAHESKADSTGSHR